ncbi:hypothetical protein ACHAXN_008832 [Cyclotella atomus]
MSALTITTCEEPGPADETEDSLDGNIVVVQDMIDAGSETPTLSEPSTDETAEEDNAEDNDDDPNNDEETTCSICLINRQGPCRKYWLKFERCMKDHSADKERREGAKKVKGLEKENKEMTSEDEWDIFMEKSITPGEEDEEDEDDDEEDEDEEQEEEIIKDDETPDDSPSLAERCDKFMIPWISCIQEHRNLYSLISNAFYQKDYVDPLEESVAENQRKAFIKAESSIGEKDGYIVKFVGAEVDLGNWREHVEADADENGVFLEEEETRAATTNTDEPHLINAYAKFRLMEPDIGNPIEVAYIKDQRGRLLGFDSFSKRDDKDDERNMHADQEKMHDGSTMEHNKVHDGECTFHIVPEETTSVAAYAIYRSKRMDENGEEQRDFVLYYTPQIRLPGNQVDN